MASSAAMAPALPKKMAAGSRPERRRLSRAPSAASTAKARWMASSAQKSTATQNSPAAALARRQPPHLHTGQTSGEAEAIEGLIHRRPPRSAGRPGDEVEVVGDGEVLVERRGVAQQGKVAADRPAIAAEVVAQHDGLALDDGHEPGARPQKGRLAGAVRTLHQHDFPP